MTSSDLLLDVSIYQESILKTGNARALLWIEGSYFAGRRAHERLRLADSLHPRRMNPYTGDLLWVGFWFLLGDNYSRDYFALVFEVDELDAQLMLPSIRSQ
jgi:hypothetical protein